MTKRVAFLALPATMLALLPYSFGLSFYFVADDFRYLELAGQVQTPADILAHIQGACTRAGWPVVVFIFWLARSVAGLQPAVYRLFPLAIHGMNVALVFALVQRVTRGRAVAAALVAALIVALHPRQHESLMWLAALTWPTGTMFLLVAAICYVTWRQTFGLAWLAAAAISAILAMISNPTVIMLPLIVATYDLLHGRWGKAAVGVWISMTMIMWLLGMLCGLGSLPQGSSRVSYGLGLSGMTHLVAFLSYIIWPVPLNLKDMLTTSPMVGYALAGVMAGLVALAGLLIIVKGTLLARWGVVWSVLSILPPAFFSAYVSDRYMSVMLVGVALTCAGVTESLSPRHLRTAAVIGLLWIAFALSQVVVKMGDWQQASQLTATVRDETLARYPQVPDGTQFYYVDLPDMVNRSLVWSYGIDSAVRLWYNNPTLRAHKNVEFGVPIAPAAEDLVLDFSGRWSSVIGE